MDLLTNKGCASETFKLMPVMRSHKNLQVCISLFERMKYNLQNFSCKIYAGHLYEHPHM